MAMRDASTPSGPVVEVATTLESLPEIDLRHMLRLTDDTGLFQHAKYALPHFDHGYCIDDNARALIAAVVETRLHARASVLPANHYLTFVVNAFNDEARRFRNFMSYDRRWLEDFGSEDSQGRALWALGLAVNQTSSDEIRLPARELFLAALPAVHTFAYLRSRAFALLGILNFVQAEGEHEECIDLLHTIAESLFHTLKMNASSAWPWWEDVVTYDNAKLPQALLQAGHYLGRRDLVQVALDALDWLLRVQTASEGHLSIIGNNGWMRRGGERAQFDQQPLEAHALVEACLAAAETTGDQVWVSRALTCFDWFLGRNDLGLPLYDPETGGGRDGLQAEGVNANQGAESTLAYVLSVLELHAYRARQSQGASDVQIRTEPLGMAILGASKFAEFALQSYEKLEGLAPVAVWNRTPQTARRVADRYRLKAYEQIDSILADPGVNIVYIASVPSLHAEQAARAIAAGKHVLVEKPIAIHENDANALIAAARHADRVLMINFMMRYGPLATAVGEIFRTGLLGNLLRGYVVNCAGDDGLPNDHWFWDESLSGGIFVEHGVHFFDLLRSWVGEGRALSAYEERRDGIVDQVGCEVRYDSGPVISYYHGFTQSHHLDRQEVHLIFERGEVRLHGWVARRVEIAAVLDDARIAELQAIFPGSEASLVRLVPGDSQGSRRLGQEKIAAKVRLRWTHPEDKQEVYADSLRELMADFVRAIRHPGFQPRVTPEDGLASLHLALTARNLSRPESG